MWQPEVRRGLNILHGAPPETLKDLFATTSEVEKMDGMVQTLQSMLAVIEARKAVVEQREAARLAEAAFPAVQGTLSSFLLKPAHPIQVTSISEDATAEVEASAPKKGGRPKGKRTNKDLRDGATEHRVSSRSSGSTSASPYEELDLRRSNRIDHMDAEPNYPAPNMDDAAAIMGVLRFLASSDRPTTRGKAYQLAALYSNFSERTVRRHFQHYWKTGELPASQQGRHAKTLSYMSDATVRKARGARNASRGSTTSGSSRRSTRNRRTGTGGATTSTSSSTRRYRSSASMRKMT